jgi:hypothetical protein
MPFRRLLVTALFTVAFASTAHAGMKLELWRGHLSLGYGHLFSDSTSPGGSFSVAAGVDYTLSPSLRLGPTVSMSLFGSYDAQSGSFVATVDHSMLDAALQLHWLPAGGPITRVSFGPGVAAARGDLQVGAGGASFLPLAVDEVRGEAALDLSMLPRRQKVVAVGFETGLRWVPVSRVDWWVVTARLTIHY